MTAPMRKAISSGPRARLRSSSRAVGGSPVCSVIQPKGPMNQQRVSNPGKTDPMLGRVVAGRYRLEARAGEGGMGVVYRARHVLIDRVVALKLIRPDLRGETHLRAWMLREARAANRVDQDRKSTRLNSSHI